MGKIANNGYISDLLQLGGVLDRTLCYNRQLIEEDFSGDYPGGSLQQAPLEKYAMNQLVREEDIQVGSPTPQPTYVLGFNLAGTEYTRAISLKPNDTLLTLALGSFFSFSRIEGSSTTGINVSATSSASWISGVIVSVQPSGSTILGRVTVNISRNTTGVTRTGTITITQQVTGNTIRINITQEGGIPSTVSYDGPYGFGSYTLFTHGDERESITNGSFTEIAFKQGERNWYFETTFFDELDFIVATYTFSNVTFAPAGSTQNVNGSAAASSNVLTFTVNNTLLGGASAVLTTNVTMNGIDLGAITINLRADP